MEMIFTFLQSAMDQMVTEGLAGHGVNRLGSATSPAEQSGCSLPKAFLREQDEFLRHLCNTKGLRFSFVICEVPTCGD